MWNMWKRGCVRQLMRTRRSSLFSGTWWTCSHVQLPSGVGTGKALSVERIERETVRILLNRIARWKDTIKKRWLRLFSVSSWWEFVMRQRVRLSHTMLRQPGSREQSRQANKRTNMESDRRAIKLLAAIQVGTGLQEPNRIIMIRCLPVLVIKIRLASSVYAC